MRELLFSVTKKDLEIQTFRSGGKGGQNQNKVNSGVRIIHKDSGARGEARDSRDQKQNKKAAFQRMINTKEFKNWHRIEVARRTGEITKIENKVEQAMKPQNIKIEIKNDENKWEEL